MRRGWIGLLAAAIVAALAIAFPTLAVLVGQASVLGLILSAVALGLRRRLTKPVRKAPSTAGSTNFRVRSSYRPDSMVAPAPSPSASVTPSLPIVSESER